MEYCRLPTIQYSQPCTVSYEAGGGCPPAWKIQGKLLFQGKLQIQFTKVSETYDIHLL